MLLGRGSISTKKQFSWRTLPHALTMLSTAAALVLALLLAAQCVLCDEGRAM